jgi:mitochondrial intermediate peptidase
MSLPLLMILGDYQRCHGSLFSIENNIVRAFHDLTSSTANVKNFPDALMDRPRPFVQSALHILSLRKQAHLSASHLPIIQAWDRDFYCPPKTPATPFLLPPLTLGTAFMGLSRLFLHLYSVSFLPAEVTSGEVWHEMSIS